MNPKQTSKPKNRTKLNHSKVLKKIRNIRWIEVLQVIGESKKPLSGREIEKGWYTKYRMNRISTPEREKKKVNKDSKGWIGSDGKRKYKKEMSYGDIYRVVKILAGFPSGKTTFLCNLDKLFQPTILSSQDQEYLKNLINGARRILGIHVLNYADRDRIETHFQIYPKEEEQEIALTFKKWVYPDKSPQETLMEIKIKINMNMNTDEKQKQKGSMFTLKIPDHPIQDVPLYVKRDGQSSYNSMDNKNALEFGLYISEDHTETGFLRNRTPFIDYTLSESAQARISKLREGMKPTPFRDAETKEVIDGLYYYWPETESDERRSLEIAAIENDHRNFVFFLTIHGFLLYLRGGQDSRKITKVIKSLGENEYVRNQFPFLWNYNIFDETYGPNYKINVLREIAFELQNQIVSSDKNFLLYWITKRFHFAMIYAQSFPSAGPIYGDSINSFQRDIIRRVHKSKKIDDGDFVRLANELRSYDRKMLELLKDYEEKRLNLTISLLKNLQELEQEEQVKKSWNA